MGNASVSATDNVSLPLDIDRSSVAPYLSLVWGNRLSEKSEFSFSAALGVMAPLSDTDISLVLADPDDLISQENVNLEKRQIKNDFDGAIGFTAVSVHYHF